MSILSFFGLGAPTAPMHVPTDHIDEIVGAARAEQQRITAERSVSRRQHANDINAMKLDSSRAQEAWKAYDLELAAKLALMRRVAELEAQLRGEAPPSQPVVEILCDHLHDSRMDLRALREAIDVALEDIPERKHQGFLDKVLAAYQKIGTKQREDVISHMARREKFRSEHLKEILS